MRLSKRAVNNHSANNHSGRRKSRMRAAAVDFTIQTLEMRQMLSGEYIANPIPPVLAHTSSPASDSLTLNQYFNDTDLPGTLATFSTTEGTIYVALTDAATPNTVANFISYVESGAYNNTIFHRSVDLNDNSPASPSDPATIIQGGGYNISGGGLTHIATNAPVADEYTTELYGDVAGTLAMAKTTLANSATSEWYFNVTDNTELDTPTTDANGATTSYTVFGNVISGTNVLSTIAKLPTDTLQDTSGNSLSGVPIVGLTEAQLQAGAAINEDNLVFTQGVSLEPGTNYTVTSDDPNLVTPKVTNGVLSFTYGPGFGTAAITITGTNIYDNSTATTKVLVTVPNSSEPSAGPTAVNITAPFTVTGTTGNFPILTNSTDSLAALEPGSVQIVTGPAHGTATVDTSDGYIVYSPGSYVGNDSLTFTIGDANGSVSNVATVTLQAVPTPVQVTIGADGVKMLNFTQPDGTQAHLSLINGQALITFTSFQVTLSGPTNGVLTATGAGATITGIAVSDHGTNAELDLKATGPVMLGSITDQYHLSINAPQATLSGNCSTGSSAFIRVAALNHATLTLGASPVLANLYIPSVADSSIVDLTTITNITSTQWVNTDGGDYSITAPSIQFMKVTGAFDEKLNLDSRGYDIFDGKIGTPGGAWNCSGSIFKVQVGTPASGWSMSVNGLIHSLNVQGNLGSNASSGNSITAAVISSMVVTGTTTGATIETSGSFFKRYLQIGNITFKGAVSNTVVYSAGNIGTITAASFVDSRIYAGVELSVAENGGLATSASNISNDAKITAVVLKTGGAGFSGAEISADLIGSLSLGKIITTTNDLAEGISAHQIGSITGTLSPGGVLHLGPAQLKTAAALMAYETKAKLALGNLSINLF